MLKERWTICIRGLSDQLVDLINCKLLLKVQVALHKKRSGMFAGLDFPVGNIFNSRIDTSIKPVPNSARVILISDWPRVVTEEIKSNEFFRIFVTSTPCHDREWRQLFELLQIRKNNSSLSTAIVFLSTRYNISEEVAAAIAEFMCGNQLYFADSSAVPFFNIVSTITK